MANGKHETTRVVRPDGGLLHKDRFDSAQVLKGLWRDEVYKKVNGVEKLVEQSDFKSNMIVVGMPKLLAGLMANDASFFGGIMFHAQGRGDPSFDISLPSPDFNATALTDEYYRKPPDSISYLLADGSPSPAVSNILLIRTTLDFSEANGPGSGEYIREQGLYGGPATAAGGSGILANLIFHRARWKDSTVKIVRFIQLIF